MKRSYEIEFQQSEVMIKVGLQDRYNQSIQALLQYINRVMALTEPKTVAGVQSYALRNYLDILDSIPAQASKSLTQAVVDFVKSVQGIFIFCFLIFAFCFCFGTVRMYV